MVAVNGTGRIAPPIAAPRRRGTGDVTGGFSLPEAVQAQALPATAELSATPTLPEGEATVADRHARRRGRGLLLALGALQHALLGGAPADGALAAAADLLDGPPADDPALQAAVDALALRVRIEIARGGA